MNDERVAKILDWLADRITKAESFVLEQAPDVVQQIITMDVIGAVIHAAVLVAAALVSFAVGAWLWRVAGRFSDPTDVAGTRIVGCGLIWFASSACLFFAVGDATLVVKATYAPKAYLLTRVGVLK